jgi:hypothetical protein
MHQYLIKSVLMGPNHKTLSEVQESRVFITDLRHTISLTSISKFKLTDSSCKDVNLSST